MIKIWILILFVSLVGGCDHEIARMEHPEEPQGRYRQQIAVAKHLLEQKESWSDRVEWEVLKLGEGWEVIGWRVEHPELKGSNRYLPWGCSVIELDRRLVPVKYHCKG